MHSRTARGRLVALIVFLGLAGAAPALAAVNPTSVARPFTVRYAINTNGDIALAANTLLTCQPGTAETQTLTSCENAQAGSPGDDNYFAMGPVNVDPTTFNSSSAALSVPAGATVLFAGLYWGAALDQGETLPSQCDPAQPRTGAPAPDPAAAGSALLRLPGGGGFVPVSAGVLDTYTEDLLCPAPGVEERTRYQAFADVTTLVKLGGGGTYTVANVQAGTGADRHAGWSLVVAYQDASQPARNLTVFDGFAQVATNNTVPLDVSGFKTPLTGPVNTQLGIVSYEGDLTLTGDSLALNGTTLSDAARPGGNFFNSTISHLGAAVTAKTPDHRNQLGFDASVLAVPGGVVENGATSAAIELRTVGDRYLPGVVFFRTDIYAPEMVLHKSVTDVNGGDVNPGDVLEYSISSTNTGVSSAYNAHIDDAIPPNTTFQPGSLSIVQSPGAIAGPKTDPADADQAEHDGTSVRFRIGTGAGPVAGRRARERRLVRGAVPRRRQRRDARRDADPQHRDPLEQGRGRHRLHLGRERARGRDRARRSRRDDRQVAHGRLRARPAGNVQPDRRQRRRPPDGGRGRDRRHAAGRSRRRGRERRRLDLRRRHRSQLAALRARRRARDGRRLPGGERPRERARERAGRRRQHRRHRWRRRDQHRQQPRRRHRRDHVASPTSRSSSRSRPRGHRPA